jgi:hypothetical protein
MSGRTRLAVAGLVLLGLLSGALLVAFAANACPVTARGQPCPEAGANRAVVVALAATSVGLLVTPFAFLAEFAARRQIVYRGAWGRATRRGLLVAAGLAAFAGLRLGGALGLPAAILVALLAAAGEWYAIRRFDRP